MLQAPTFSESFAHFVETLLMRFVFWSACRADVPTGILAN